MQESSRPEGSDDSPPLPSLPDESKTVHRSRLVLLVVLLGSAIGVSTGLYVYIRNSEYDAFEDHFQDTAHKVFEAIGSGLDDTFGAFDALAATIVVHAHGTGQTWPFVTVPNFGLSASKTLGHSVMKMIVCLPLVTPENRMEWESYSIANGKAWVDQDLALLETDPNYFGPVYYEYVILSCRIVVLTPSPSSLFLLIKRKCSPFVPGTQSTG